MLRQRRSYGTPKHARVSSGPRYVGQPIEATGLSIRNNIVMSAIVALLLVINHRSTYWSKTTYTLENYRAIALIRAGRTRRTGLEWQKH